MSIYPGVNTGVVRHNGIATGFHDGGLETGPPIILIHGTGGRTESHFFTLYPMLASRHRVIGVDLPASSATGDDMTVASLVDQVWAVVDARLPGRRVALAGYSLGACIAAAAAARRPAQTEALVLLNGWAQTDNALRLRFRLWQLLRERGTHEELATYMLMSIYGRSFIDSIPYIGPRPWSQVEEMLDAYAVGPGSDAQVRLNLSMDLGDKLGRIRARTLVIGSVEDQYIPFAHSRELFGAIEGAALAAIGGGHGSVTERPAEVFHLIDRFLRDPDAYPAGRVVGDDSVLQLARPEREDSHAWV